jgi:thiamine transport system substrate-binding protein
VNITTKSLRVCVVLFLFWAGMLHAESSLVVYTEDSFLAPGGMGPVLKEKFEKHSGQKIHYVAFGSVGEALNQIAIEGSGTRADVLLGIDESLASRAKELGLFAPLPSNVWSEIPENLCFDSSHVIAPFDYGYLSFVYDSERTPVPASLTLAQFAAQPSFHKKVVIEDPRTSSLGMSFLTWSHLALSGDSFKKFWKDLNESLLTIAPGWTGAFALFNKKEADLVLSYTTSPAYYLQKKKTSIKAIAFTDGNLRQVEGAAITKSSKAAAVAQSFVEFLLSEEAQREIPLHAWMYPVRAGIRLPASFKALPQVDKVLITPPHQPYQTKKDWLRQWSRLLSTGR